MQNNDAKAKRTISIAVAYVILCSTAIGMEFRKEADRKHAGLFLIYATGQIVPGDRTTFERLATNGSHDIVFLSSSGAGLRADLIKRLNAKLPRSGDLTVG